MIRTHNSAYILFSTLSVLLLVAFFTSNTWMGDTRDYKNEGYNQTITLGTWNFKITNAEYDNKTMQLTFDFFIKEKQSENQSSEPTIYKITQENDKSLTFMSNKLENSEYGSHVAVENVENDFYYVRVYIQSKEADITPEPTIDEFGNMVTYDTIEGEMKEYWINIDYRECNKLSITPMSDTEETTYVSTLEETSNMVSETLVTEAITTTTVIATTKETEVINTTDEPTNPIGGNVVQPTPNSQPTQTPTITQAPETDAQKPTPTQVETQAPTPVVTTIPKQTTTKETTTLPDNYIKLEWHNISINEGELGQLKYSVNLKNTNDITYSVSFTSSDNDIVTVDTRTGKYITMKKGVVVVRVEAITSKGVLSDICEITVT